MLKYSNCTRQEVSAMGRPISIIKLTAEEEAELTRRVRAAKTPRRDSERARIVLLLSQGLTQTAVSLETGASLPRVNKWSQRFRRDRLAGLADKPRPGRPRTIPEEKVVQVIEMAGQFRPGRSVWSTRSMAEEVGGISHSTVQRIWKAFDIKPHLRSTFKVSTDKNFTEKFWAVVLLYLFPPANAMVLCCDEKTQCQALERTQRGLPLGIGHICTRTHDYRRHGKLNLFTCMDYATGRIIARLEARHTHKEWLRFPEQIDRETPKDMELYLIMDNYCTHKHKKVMAWLERHPRFHIYFTPTSCSWINMVERFFAEITRVAIRSGSFTSTRDLAREIWAFLNRWNKKPRTFKWKADPMVVFEKILRARAALHRELSLI